MIPGKIKPYFVTTLQKKNGDNTIIEGVLTCCNSHAFEVSCVGEIKHSLSAKMCLFPASGNLMLEVRCKKCGKVISVFDSNCDGYGLHEKNPYPRFSARPIACKRCKNHDYSVGIRYEYPAIQELEALDISEIENAFTWIWITLACNQCGMNYRNFVDFETA